MYNFFSIYIFVFYILPVAIVNPIGYPFLSTLLICGGFYIICGFKPMFASSSSQSKFREYGLSSKIISIILISYFLIRIPYIEQLFDSILYGSFSQTALTMAQERYSGEEQIDWATKLSVILLIGYATAIGQTYKKGMNRIWLVFFIIMICIESASLSRAGPLIAVMCFLCEQIIKNHSFLSKLNVLGYLKIFIVPTLFLLVLFLFSAYLRVYEDAEAITIVTHKIAEYSLAMYANFDWWFRTSWNYTFGCGMFAGVCKIFGYTLPQGIYELVVGEYGESNIFTVLRSMVEDLTPIGAAIFFLIFAFLCKKFDQYKISYLSFWGFLLRNMALILLYVFYSPFVFFAAVVGFNIPYLILSMRALKKHETNLYYRD